METTTANSAIYLNETNNSPVCCLAVARTDGMENPTEHAVHAELTCM
eukprot:CAMPEP_0181326250 /NCGR_PEP_ID=MMETSP1101-20121128/21386_1 /TAXON_ID=46948 /ORGANISM="Rhodomonas abbreviata, Strain Caron Lab Isolate" /LENGTH=46 /DNA_ID= /DNA_START= /DNA_END= /DNA_ORIENTATION=